MTTVQNKKPANSIEASTENATEHFDVIIVGAGLSGIGAAYHLQNNCPSKKYAILESRDAIGGTWDLFRYPGVRSDSDMYTLGYDFKPWLGSKALASGDTIRNYIEETAEENSIIKNIRFNHKVDNARWDSQTAKWTITSKRVTSKSTPRKAATSESVDSNIEAPIIYTANFLLMCSGYYSYDQGYTPDFKGIDDFKGQVIHPQKWPEDLDYTDKKVTVIGSGATAVTLVPAMVDKAEKVTMLQRSPTYILSLPDVDIVANAMNKYLPAKLAYNITRWKNVSMATFIYQLSRRRPKIVKKLIRAQLEKQLGKEFDIDKHFTPSYNPWDQRLCLVPNGDLFKAIRSNKAEVITDHIEKFTKTGIKLKSGELLKSDIVVTATGLNLLALGGMSIQVDGQEISLVDKMGYKGIMLSDIPNLAVVFGYTNASWTLKADLTCKYVCKILNYMDDNEYDYCRPEQIDPSISLEPFVDLNSSYVNRSIDAFPKQGSKAPWKLYQNYALDTALFKLSKVNDKYMRFYTTS